VGGWALQGWLLGACASDQGGHSLMRWPEARAVRGMASVQGGSTEAASGGLAHHKRAVSVQRRGSMEGAP
jgi:hypothetical protein